MVWNIFVKERMKSGANSTAGSTVDSVEQVGYRNSLINQKYVIYQHLIFVFFAFYVGGLGHMRFNLE